MSIDTYSINCNKCKQYFRISYTHIRYLCRHGKEIWVILFSVFVNTIGCKNSGVDVTSESYFQSTDRKHSRLQLRCFQFVNGNSLSEDLNKYSSARKIAMAGRFPPRYVSSIPRIQRPPLPSPALPQKCYFSDEMTILKWWNEKWCFYDCVLRKLMRI